VQRWFVVLSGNGVVLRMPTPDGHSRDHHLLPGHTPLQFDGGLAPFCQLEDGPTQDLNLMVRGGDACMLAVDTDAPWLSDHAMCGLYTTVGGVWSDGLQTLRLPAHTLLWLEKAPATMMRFTSDNTALLPAYWLGYSPEL
jgi:environmental stress-induced protein Ves